MNDFSYEIYKEFFRDKKIVLGITGSIAAFKAIELLRILKKCEAQVKVVCTQNALQFVTPLTLQTLSENTVLTDLSEEGKMTHIELAKWADLILIAPATANTLAKLAHGIADDLLTTEVLATRAPVFIAPAMNPSMLSHPASRENLDRLQSFHYHVLKTENGLHACGDRGEGRLLEPEKIISELISVFCAPSNQKDLLISLGPTRSALDPVRYLTNRSSGKMGLALAFSALKKGFRVEIVSGLTPEQTPLTLPPQMQLTRVVTSDEMAQMILKKFPKADYFISTAAVLDFEFPKTENKKIKKDQLQSNALAITPTQDILKTVGASKKKHQFILGFAAETENTIENARKKLLSKNCDAVFVNPVHAWSQNHQQTGGFESNQNEGHLVFAKKTIAFKLQSKVRLAEQLIQEISS